MDQTTSPRLIYRKILFCICTWLFLLTSISSPCFAQTNILLLSSYHPGKEFQDTMISTIMETLNAEDNDYEIFVEYMDSKRYTSQSFLDQTLYNQYQYTINTQSIYNQYTINTQSINNQYTINTRSIHNQYTINIQSMHNQY